VLEDAPTYRNLFGTIERWIDPLGRSFGARTNFTAHHRRIVSEIAQRFPWYRSSKMQPSSPAFGKRSSAAQVGTDDARDFPSRCHFFSG